MEGMGENAGFVDVQREQILAQQREEDQARMEEILGQEEHYARELNAQERRDAENPQNMQKTESEIAFIDNLFEKNDIQITDETRFQLEMRRNRNRAHLLVNKRKTGGDSGKMENVKNAILAVERLLENTPQVTLQNITQAQDAYATAIKHCRIYMQKRNSTHTTGMDRKKQVELNLKRLIEESKLLGAAKVICRVRPDLAEGKSLENMLFVAKYNKTFPVVQNNANAPQVQVAYEEPQENTELSDIVSMLRGGVTTVDLLKNKKRKFKTSELVAIKNVLRKFQDGEINAEEINFRGTGLLFVQDEQNNLTLRCDGHEYNLGASALAICSAMEMDMVSHEQIYGTDNTAEILNSYEGVDLKKTSVGDLIQLRNLSLASLEKKCKVPTVFFNRIPTSLVRTLATHAANGDMDAEEIKDFVEKYSDPTEEMSEERESAEISIRAKILRAEPPAREFDLPKEMKSEFWALYNNIKSQLHLERDPQKREIIQARIKNLESGMEYFLTKPVYRNDYEQKQDYELAKKDRAKKSAWILASMAELSTGAMREKYLNLMREKMPGFDKDYFKNIPTSYMQRLDLISIGQEVVQERDKEEPAYIRNKDVLKLRKMVRSMDSERAQINNEEGLETMEILRKQREEAIAQGREVASSSKVTGLENVSKKEAEARKRKEEREAKELFDIQTEAIEAEIKDVEAKIAAQKAKEEAEKGGENEEKKEEQGGGGFFDFFGVVGNVAKEFLKPKSPEMQALEEQLNALKIQRGTLQSEYFKKNREENEKTLKEERVDCMDRLRNLFADLIFSKDTYIEDDTLMDPGKRLMRVLSDNAEAVAYYLMDPKLLEDTLDTMPITDEAEEFRESVKEAFTYIQDKVDVKVRMLLKAGSVTDVADHIRNLTKEPVMADTSHMSEAQKREAEEEYRAEKEQYDELYTQCLDIEATINASIDKAADQIQAMVIKAIDGVNGKDKKKEKGKEGEKKEEGKKEEKKEENKEEKKEEKKEENKEEKKEEKKEENKEEKKEEKKEENKEKDKDKKEDPKKEPVFEKLDEKDAKNRSTLDAVEKMVVKLNAMDEDALFTKYRTSYDLTARAFAEMKGAGNKEAAEKYKKSLDYLDSIVDKDEIEMDALIKCKNFAHAGLIEDVFQAGKDVTEIINAISIFSKKRGVDNQVKNQKKDFMSHGGKEEDFVPDMENARADAESLIGVVLNTKDSVVREIKEAWTRDLIRAFEPEQQEIIKNKIGDYMDRMFKEENGKTVVDDDVIDEFDTYLTTEFREYIAMHEHYQGMIDIQTAFKKEKGVEPTFSTLSDQEKAEYQEHATAFSSIYARKAEILSNNELGVGELLKRMQKDGNDRVLNDRMKAIEKEFAPMFADKDNRGDELRATFNDYKNAILSHTDIKPAREAFKAVYIEVQRKRMKALQNAVQKEEIANRMLTVKEGKEKLNKIMEDSAKGNAGQGLFFKNVMRTYFAGVSTMDKRAMFASAMRQAKPLVVNKKTDEVEPNMDLEAVFLSGYLKGAGPLLQKMLQGLPDAAVPKELKGAIRDMKSRLLPISQEFVEAQLNSMIERSHGSITKIDIKRALGAASVGQTFLCTVYGPKMKQGKEVVIKILRPEVKNRMEREEKIMLEAARATNKGMEGTYKGQLERIREEMDLTIETHNVELGKVYDKPFKNKKKTSHVKSMKTDKMVDSTANSMVIEKAPGITVDQYLEELREYMGSIKRNYLDRTKDGRLIMKKDYEMSITEYHDYEQLRAEMCEKIRQLRKRFTYMDELANKWVEEGIFGEGFYHGDLHAGNIMVSDEGLTVIDFGNVTKLEKAQKEEITRMMVAAAAGDANDFYNGYLKLLGTTDPEFTEKNKDKLRKVVENTFLLGNKESAGTRIATVLMRAQEIGFQLPAAIYNFSQCQIRLQNAMDEMEKLDDELVEDVIALNMLPDGVVIASQSAFTPPLFAAVQVRRKNLIKPNQQFRYMKDVKFSLGYLNEQEVLEDLHKESDEDIELFKWKHLPEMTTEADEIMADYKKLGVSDSLKSLKGEEKARQLKRNLEKFQKNEFAWFLEHLRANRGTNYLEEFNKKAEPLLKNYNPAGMKELLDEIKEEDITYKLYLEYCDERKKKPAKNAPQEDKDAYRQRVQAKENEFLDAYRAKRNDIDSKANWFADSRRGNNFVDDDAIIPGGDEEKMEHIEALCGGKYDKQLKDSYKALRDEVDKGGALNLMGPEYTEFEKYYKLASQEKIDKMLVGQFQFQRARQTETQNFYGVMSDVITQNSGDAFLRVGLRKLNKYSKMM
ncbi:MAG: phosphotransferase [Lachnospiraceae bacterium]|nr:phosphotransferase [Lachnospiraceae bacterium]